MNDFSWLPTEFHCCSGARDDQIAESETQLGRVLPPDYVEFLRVSNGGEGFIGKNAYLILWGVEELHSLNRDYEVEDAAPGLLVFGSNGGGEAFGFDTRSSGWPVVKVPFVVMDWKDARSMGGSFGDFLRRLHETKD